MTVAMALAEQLHHSVNRVERDEALRRQTTRASEEEVENVARDGLRAQKSPPPGVRPGSLVDPGPQRSDRTLRRSSGKDPLLVVASLADASADGVDAATLSFLTASALEARRKEEEEEEQQVVQPVPDSVEWVELCGVDGKTHFWNRRSNETAWNPPEGIQVVWVGTKDSKGVLYFWHKVSRASTYVLPPLPPG